MDLIDPQNGWLGNPNSPIVCVWGSASFFNMVSPMALLMPNLDPSIHQSALVFTIDSYSMQVCIIIHTWLPDHIPVECPKENKGNQFQPTLNVKSCEPWWAKATDQLNHSAGVSANSCSVSVGFLAKGKSSAKASRGNASPRWMAQYSWWVPRQVPPWLHLKGRLKKKTRRICPGWPFRPGWKHWG